MDYSIPGFPVLHHLLESAQTHLHWVSDATQLSHPLSSLSAINLSQHQGLFQGVGSLCKMSRVLELQLQHHSFQWIFSQIPQNSDCILQFLFVFYGTLFEVSFLNILLFNFTVHSLLQHHSPKASVLQCSVFFMIQLSHPAIGRTIALTVGTFVGKVTSLLFNMLPRFVIIFLPRGRRLLISLMRVYRCVDLQFPAPICNFSSFPLMSLSYHLELGSVTSTAASYHFTFYPLLSLISLPLPIDIILFAFIALFIFSPPTLSPPHGVSVPLGQGLILSIVFATVISGFRTAPEM